MFNTEFRAWDFANNKWIHDFLISENGELLRYGCFEPLDNLYNVELEKSVGLNDSKTKAGIFVNDFCVFFGERHLIVDEGLGSGYYWHKQFHAFAGHTYINDIKEQIYVIGNTHENPELILKKT